MAADPHASPPPGFATLAKRISAWTTRGLLSAMVLVAGVGFGRQVLRWWGNDDATAESGRGTPQLLPAELLGNPRQPHSIRFGEAAWSLSRRSIVGDRTKAIEQLRAECREQLRNIKPRPSVAPPGAITDPTAPGATDGRGFMALLSDSAPVDREPSKWRLYEFHETFPMAVGVARPPASHGEPKKGRVDLARLGYRAIMWGVAIPAGTNEWSLCVFRPADCPREEESGSIKVPVPPGCRRTLSLQAVGGGGITAFSGPDRPAQWKRFHDDWFARRGWRPAVPWRSAGNAWYAKYTAPDSTGGAVEIRFAPDGRGESSGLLMITPPESR